MAYKFQLGRHKLQSGSSLDVSAGDIELGNDQVDSADVRNMAASKLHGAAKPQKALTYNALPANTNTIKFSYNSTNYVVTVTAGAGTDDVAITDGSATLYLGNHANADSFYAAVVNLLQDPDLPDLSAAHTNGGDSNNAGTITIQGEVPGVAFAAWGASGNDALPGTGVASSSTTAGAEKFMKLSNAGIVEQSAADMRTSLGLAIGSNVQAYDAQLADVAGLTPDDGKFIVGDGSNFVVESGATARTSLGLTIGTHVQAYDAQLADIAGLTPSDGNVIIGDGSNFVLESGGTLRTSLGLAIGTNVQAYDADLAALAGLTSAADKGIQWTGSGTAGTYDLTAAGKALLDDADAAAQRTTLGLGAMATAASVAIGNIAAGTLVIESEGIASNDNDSTIPTSAAVKDYVDSVAQGLDVKDSVVAAYTASFTMASTASSSTLVLADGEGGFSASGDSLTIDGVTVPAGSRVLVNYGVNSNDAGVDHKWNGIYTVGALNGVTLTLTRATDFNDAGASGNISSGGFVFIEQGSANADTGWVMTQDAAITLGTTALTWSQFSGAGSITAGTGITKTGSTLNLDATHAAITQIYNASLVIGEDSQTRVDFATNNKIEFYADNSKRADITSEGFQLHSGVFLRKVQTIASGTSSTLNFANGEVVLFKFGTGGVTANYTATLPAASGKSGMVISFKRMELDGNSHDLTIASNGSEKIDGDTSNLVLDGDSPDAAVSLICDGTEWYIM